MKPIPKGSESNVSQYRMTDRKVDRPTCIEIKVERLTDDDPDLSWLDQSDEEMGEGYEAYAHERKESYGYAWSTIGIQVAAIYLVPVGSSSSLQTLVSPGMYGIESDSDAAHLTEIEDEEIATVRMLMDALGIVYEGVEVER